MQLGLLPRSVRVGRKGKHRGSQGLYPATVVRQIELVRRLMAQGYGFYCLLDEGTGIALDSARNAYVAGRTDSPNFPTTGALQVMPFVERLNTSARRLIGCTTSHAVAWSSCTSAAVSPFRSAAMPTTGRRTGTCRKPPT